MTKLTKIVAREASHTAEQGRPLMVALEPADTISFRLKGCRKVWRTTLAACFWMAVKAEALEEQRIRRQIKKERARARRR